MKTSKKILALADYLQINKDEITVSAYDLNSFEVGKNEYMVLTDKEATKKAKEEIKESVWAFRARYLTYYFKVEMPEKSIKKLQEELSEDANDILLALIKNFNKFAEDAISADGRGHFISHYDGKENEHNGCFIYRTN